MMTKEIHADGSCKHGILIVDTCFDCEIRQIAEEDRAAKRRHARKLTQRLNEKYAR